jgi:hypothetical protein
MEALLGPVHPESYVHVARGDRERTSYGYGGPRTGSALRPPTPPPPRSPPEYPSPGRAGDALARRSDGRPRVAGTRSGIERHSPRGAGSLAPRRRTGAEIGRTPGGRGGSSVAGEKSTLVQPEPRPPALPSTSSGFQQRPVRGLRRTSMPLLAPGAPSSSAARETRCGECRAISMTFSSPSTGSP